MINVKDLFELFIEQEIDFFTGVPDSQLQAFCNYITRELEIGKNHIIAANEGNAVALAAGYHMATGRTGLVYLQNSGLGNAVNPITSLTDPEVYAIPVVYMIGWRGKPGTKDEPQHTKQGKITLELLELLGIETFIIKQDTDISEVKHVLREKFLNLLKNGSSVAFVIEKNALQEEEKVKNANSYPMSREEAIKLIVDGMGEDTMVVSTTGKASRELFEYREHKELGHEKDFLTVGSMGHASMIALALEENSNKHTICIDGDGAMLMHTGALALIGSRKPKRFVHFLMNNGAHESVGGMSTISYNIDWNKVSTSMGYVAAYSANSKEELLEIMKRVQAEEGPVFVNVYINSSSRVDLIRPTIKPVDNKKNIMKYLES